MDNRDHNDKLIKLNEAKRRREEAKHKQYKEDAALVNSLAQRDYCGVGKAMLDAYEKDSGIRYHQSALSRAKKGKANFNLSFMQWVRAKLALQHTSFGVYLPDIQKDPLVLSVELLLKHGHDNDALSVLKDFECAAKPMGWDNRIAFIQSPALRAIIHLRSVQSTPHDVTYRILNGDKVSTADLDDVKRICKLNLPLFEQAHLDYSIARNRAKSRCQENLWSQYTSCIYNLERDIAISKFLLEDINRDKYKTDLNTLLTDHEELVKSKTTDSKTRYIVHQNFMRLADSLQDAELFFDHYLYATETGYLNQSARTISDQLREMVVKDADMHFAKIWIKKRPCFLTFTQSEA